MHSSPSTQHCFIGISETFFELNEFFWQVLDEEVDDNDAIVPIIYEDEDDSDDQESGDEMETDEDEEEEEREEAFGDLSAGEVDDMSE